MQATRNRDYRTYGLSMWRWVSEDFGYGPAQLRKNIDAELAAVLAETGLRQASADEAPDLLLRYEAAPGVLVAELVDARTNERVWRTDLRGPAKPSASEAGLFNSVF